MFMVQLIPHAEDALCANVSNLGLKCGKRLCPLLLMFLRSGVLSVSKQRTITHREEREEASV